MEIKNAGQAIELLIRVLPYPEQILGIDTETNKDAIYFTWRTNRYKLEFQKISVYRVNGVALEGNDTSMLIRTLIEKQWVIDYLKENNKD